LVLWWCRFGTASIKAMAMCRLSGDLRQEDARMPMGPVPAALRGRYAGDRIVAGARFLDYLDPGWWQAGAWLPASLTALDMADPYRCLLAWWAAQHLPAPPRRGPRQVPPYDRAMLALCLSSQQAQALGFTGADADLLTPGWRHLIAHLRASHDRRPHPGTPDRSGHIPDLSRFGDIPDPRLDTRITRDYVVAAVDEPAGGCCVPGLRSSPSAR
jgi:hypothetical protein